MSTRLIQRSLVLLVAIAICAGTASAADDDGDLLTNDEEIDSYGTSPTNPDSDGDGTPDGLEVHRGLDPTNPSEKLDRPNVIFVLVDDLGWGDLGVFYQNARSDPKKHATPHLDTMASEGLQMRAHYCPAPICQPSRGSLLNGVHQGHSLLRNKQFDDALELNHTLATVMKSAGYATSAIGKYGLQGTSGNSPSTWVAYPTDRGFDFFFGYVRHRDGHQHYPGNTWPLGNSPDHRKKKECYENNEEISADLDKCFTPDLFTARAKKWIKDHVTASPNQPFFMYLAYDTPHAALQLPTVAYPDGGADPSDPGGLDGGVQWIGTPGNMINTATGTIDSYKHPDYTGKGWTDVEERFATLVRRHDDNLGDLIQTIKDLNIDDNTLIIFTSDNGPHNQSYIDGIQWEANHFDSFGPYDGIKSDGWEGGIRMPTLIRWPGGISTPGIVSAPSQFQDWMPTLSALAGWTGPSRSDGVSLLPTLTGTGTQKDSLIYIEYSANNKTPSYPEFDPSNRGQRRGEMQVVHLDGHKGIRIDIKSHADDFEIYDLDADPSESNNLAGTSSYFGDLQQRMKDRVLRIRQPEQADPHDPASRVNRRPYDDELVPPVTETTTNGVEYATFEGIWPWIPEFTGITPSTEGTGVNFNLGHLRRRHDAGLLFSGFIKIPADGTWTFYATSDAGSHLRLHEAQVIDDDFSHDGTEASGTMKLKAGLHPFRLYYRTGKATPALRVSWSGPGVSKEPIPDDVLFYKDVPVPDP